MVDFVRKKGKTMMVALTMILDSIDSIQFNCWHLQRLTSGVDVDCSEVLGQGEMSELTLNVIVCLQT